MKFRAEFDDRGFKEVWKRLQRMKAPTEVPLDELMSETFMTRHTKYPSFHAFLEAVGVDSLEKLQAISDNPASYPDFDRFVAANSQFGSFSEMVQAAAVAYYGEQLGF